MLTLEKVATFEGPDKYKIFNTVICTDVNYGLFGLKSTCKYPIKFYYGLNKHNVPIQVESVQYFTLEQATKLKAFIEQEYSSIIRKDFTVTYDAG
jgi:hypothetical protein